MRAVHIAVVALVVAALSPAVWLLVMDALAPPPAPPPPPAALQSDLARAEARIEELSARVGALESRIALGSRQEQERDTTESPPPAEDPLAGSYAQVVQIAGRRDVNTGLSNATPGYLKELLGLPREDLNDAECMEEMTNPTLAGMLVSEDVGPIRVKMLRPAILSLRQVFRNVEVFSPNLHSRIRSSGSLCIRLIRGSRDAVSAHAYGLALDINIDGVLDELGDGKSQLGLILLSDFFQKEGWYWGAGFGREDSMHFEVSREKLEQWRRLGEIPPLAAAPQQTAPAQP